MQIRFDNSYARELEGMYVPWQGSRAPAPKMLLLNEVLADELGLDAQALQSPEGLAMLTGSAMPEGASPLAMAYAGHQFGGFSPQLGDGRALLVGEVINRQGRRRDIHLKGSGRTPFARGGDGKAALGPVLREYIIGEAMAALGIPTTRALAAVATGETVLREEPLPGAVLARVGASHLRVGSFQFFLARGDIASLKRLADYAIRRHDPELEGRDDCYLAFLQAVTARQMALVAQWMAVGFVHGVMNTDNCAISGETIDYGPCAFVDVYDPQAVFSSIDTGGRYAYANQPLLAQWNLARLAETLLPLIAPENPESALPEARAVIDGAAGIYTQERRRRFGAKLGLAAPGEDDEALIDGFLDMLAAKGADFTQSFRALIDAAGGDAAALSAQLRSAPGLNDWLTRWRKRLDAEKDGAAGAVARMQAANPVYIPRNHLVEAALADAQGGNLETTRRLLEALAQPFTECAGFEAYAAPAPSGFGPYVTYCGT
ncbi:MAG: YdiU family protein [Pararhodobacter sp.]|nr:YdiU family protein [Pararhodobacter sp.]